MTTPTARQFADQFKEVLRRQLSPAELLKIDQTNHRKADRYCATHDYCDANMAMLQAVVELTGLDEDEATDRLVRGDLMLDAVNDGWTLAKIEGFSSPAQTDTAHNHTC